MVTGVDVNERAVLLANENAARLGVADRYTAATPDGVRPADATYDEIWSNPPIRIGKEALHDLLLTWFARLAPEGRAVMVVGKNLGADSLQRWLGDQGYPTERLASAKGFRVLESRPDVTGLIQTVGQSSRSVDELVVDEERVQRLGREVVDADAEHVAVDLGVEGPLAVLGPAPADEHAGPVGHGTEGATMGP